ncbi:MAG: hypothetical protein AAFY71_20400 [Bacteroidota bacterium]
MKNLFYFFWGMILVILMIGCEEGGLAITPTSDITFVVTDNASNAVENARVYLFRTRSSYEGYVADNPTGDASISPSLSAENVGTTDSQGRVTFVDFDLDGSNYASGSTFFFNPNPIYYRVEGANNLTNDNGDNKLSYDELESGTVLTETIDVIIE